MASLQWHHEWAKKLQEEKYCFVAYTGQSTRVNTSRWYALEPDTWLNVRYGLESCNASNMEKAALGQYTGHYDARPPSTSVLRGFQAFGQHSRSLGAFETWPDSLTQLLDPARLQRVDLPSKELVGSDYLMPNTFTFVCFDSMPLGSRPYVPLKDRSDYALVMHAIENAPTEKARLKATREKVALEASYESRFHACDRPRSSEFIKAHGVTSEVVYSEPPLDYLCVECNKHGHHYREACFLWPKDAPRFVMGSFGHKKFGKALAVDTSDPLLYSLLYKKKAGLL